MKILLHDYGGYAFTHQLGGALADRGHLVQFVYSETTQQVKRFNGETKQNLTLHSINLKQSFAKYKYWQRHQAEVSYGHKATNSILDFEPDVVISANTPLDAQRLIQKASQQVGAKFIFWMQDVISLATAQALRERFTPLGKAVGLYYRNIEKALLHHSNQIIVISGGFLPLLQAWHIPADKIHLIPNWAPVDQITPQPHDNPWSAQMGLAHTFNFLYTGILGLKHDPSIFLDLGQHFQHNPDVRIVIVSKGERFEWLRAKAHQRGINNLVLIEFQPSQVYPLILAAGDVLVSVLNPTAGDYSVPSKVMGYLCAQRPILLSVPMQNLTVEMVIEAGAGLASPPGDHKGFLHQARLLSENEKTRYNMGCSGRQYAEANFNIDAITHLFESLIT